MRDFIDQLPSYKSYKQISTNAADDPEEVHWEPVARSYEDNEGNDTFYEEEQKQAKQKSFWQDILHPIPHKR